MEKIFTCNDPRVIEGTDFYFGKEESSYMLLKKNYNSIFLTNIVDFSVYKHNQVIYIICVTEEEFIVYYVNDCQRLKRIVSVSSNEDSLEFAITVNVGDNEEKELINFYSDLSFNTSNMKTFHTTYIDNVFKDSYLKISVGDESKFCSVYAKIMDTNWRYCYK